MARNLPAFTCGYDDGMLSNIRPIWLPSRSFTAGALPLYGMCWICRPVMELNSSPDRCIDEPLPDEPYDSLSGLALA
ncbi:hypothetical protein D3C85_1605180 [compost metagenome]